MSEERERGREREIAKVKGPARRVAKFNVLVSLAWACRILGTSLVPILLTWELTKSVALQGER